MKKSIITGIIIGTFLMSGILVGAMGTEVDGWLNTTNPIYSAPYATAKTMGYQNISAEVSVSKSGYDVKRNSVANNVGSYGGSVETSKLYGPTYASEGTNFYSVHTGYTNAGEYKYLTSSISY
jgi:hypothetical protein